MKRKSTKGLLIKGVLEKVPSEIIEVLAPKIKEILGDYAGIYALYKDDELYYVGLAKNLQGRLKTHLKDRHAGRWNRFSVFVIRRVKYLKDLETLILRIVPKARGIKIKGRIPHHHALGRELRKIVKEYRRTAEQIEKNL